MYEIEKDTYVSEKILYNEYSYRYGTKKMEIVEFIYSNVKSGKETIREFTYSQALNLARERRKDGRYKNYEYYIREK